ncbi:L-aspartate oxidase (EC 1.4.3.16) [uncultured Gammaproteobacteria bacterium]|uniref:L-aspartate oxidase n=1 Tax=Bathymodiolus heckerae thiotrophic gill symbiont TaxID=1052212 RepID=UPI0010B0FA9E|nr:L-aspartate oxidase [Bathymodiolus heckerae thiotrophic gill symbiont]CAC9580096.1 L-aspartate oxidase (EC 1.4.3.16) [uncultured Gammaproteobacteria bacterium]CAC9607214.1 L-aspartate oxidase (EC 1.4.3.16) [uncultured Gammaproteobacteria bacterium]SHN89394.1 L-aspartate oxidase [Bathymodiolus heckerae thiotrophic gill symbiont]
MSIQYQFDVLIIGTGSAGLMSALQLSTNLSVALIAKDDLLEGSSFYAQGGISAVLDAHDNFKAHVTDTLSTACGLADEKAVSFMVENAPAAIASLEESGVHFTKDNNDYHLTTEGGHTHRRVAHVADKTGQSIQINLLDNVKQRDNITLFEDYIAIDLLVNNGQCFGAYILNKKTHEVENFVTHKTILATGGASKVYRYTSNPDTSTGDGIAMASRAGCCIVNMEFAQFHPTCLYHPHAKSFLISEAIRGEGGKLHLQNGKTFMHKYDERGELAPRDVVARAIDSEMKSGGFDCAYLDISFKGKDWIQQHFPTIYAKCKSFGIDISKTSIPIVPAAHYTCGGIDTNLTGKTNLTNLYAVGEVAHTSVHGANRMASNSLLECIVFAKSCAHDINQQTLDDVFFQSEPWDASRVAASKEKVVVSHLWDEVRSIMWNFVGIVRSDRRLNYAKHRLEQIETEVDEYYSLYVISSDLIELRNLVKTAQIIIKSALSRQESRGLHFNEDHPQQSETAKNTII